MQNMIQLTKGSKNFHVFFDVDLDRQDFVNVNVKDLSGQPYELYDAELETIKDLIAEEILLASKNLMEQFKANSFLKN